MKKYLIAILFTIFSLSSKAAELYKIDPTHASINWSANHFGFSDQLGKITDVSGHINFDETDPKSSSVEVQIGVGSNVTGLAKFDEHLKSADFFNVTKFPTATFKSTSIIPSGKTFAKIKGNLTFLGVTKPVTLDTKLIKKGINPINQSKTIGFFATTTLKRSDFGINFGLPGISNLVKIEINLEATYISGESSIVPGAGPILSQNSKNTSKAIPEWKMIPEKSRLEFKVNREKSVITGSFQKFDGQIIFDKDQLPKSKIQVDVDTSSIEVSYAEALPTIRGSNWLSVTSFPKATFVSDRIILLSDANLSIANDLNVKVINDLSSVQTGKNSDINLKNLPKPNSYRANGSLTIKGKKIPASIDFVLNNYSPTQASATGQIKIKRSSFNIGDRSVQRSNGVEDDIEINFTISAER
jgi:polyisoprenoid-binding protein YceI